MGLVAVWAVLVSPDTTAESVTLRSSVPGCNALKCLICLALQVTQLTGCGIHRARSIVGRERGGGRAVNTTRAGSDLDGERGLLRRGIGIGWRVLTVLDGTTG